jgi:preprotein translocase subunit SecG
MSALYIFLTLLMFLDCVILVLLVLLQLPKKEAGAGMAFGGGATDALFGAGSGNVLTKITKYAAGIFFGLAILMAVVAGRNRSASGGAALMDELSKHSATPVGSTTPSTAPAATPSGDSGLLQSSLLTNVPPAPTTAPATAPVKPGAPTSTNK